MLLAKQNKNPILIQNAQHNLLLLVKDYNAIHLLLT